MRSVVVPTNRLIDPNDTPRRDIERRQGIQSSRDLARKIQRVKRSGRNPAVALYGSSDVVEERAQEISFTGNPVSIVRTGRRTTVAVAAVPTKTSVPTITPLAASGTGATATLTEGTDRTGLVTLVVGTSPSSGSQFRITFGAVRATNDYTVQFQRTDTGIGTVDHRPTGRTTARCDLWLLAAPMAGQTYQFYYTIEDE